jgi:hypothetical protein
MDALLELQLGQNIGELPGKLPAGGIQLYGQNAMPPADRLVRWVRRTIIGENSLMAEGC